MEMNESGDVSKPEILVVGVGGGGNNTLNRMIDAGVTGVHYVGVNTDVQALRGCRAGTKVRIGGEITQGLGAGNDPDIGYDAARFSRKELEEVIRGFHMVFVTAGAGGGTGTGAAPVIAEIAMMLGALTVGVVTRPFSFEGKRRAEQADNCIGLLQERTDALLVISNDRLFEIADAIPLPDAFRLADDVLRQGIQAVTGLITGSSLVNLDFSHIRGVLEGSGAAVIGIGHAAGRDKARRAALEAVESPLLEWSLEGSTRVLLNVSGGPDLSLVEVNEVAEIVASSVDPGASIAFGAVIDGALYNRARVTIIASGGGPEDARRKNGGNAGEMPRETVDMPTIFKGSPPRD